MERQQLLSIPPGPRVRVPLGCPLEFECYDDAGEAILEASLVPPRIPTTMFEPPPVPLPPPLPVPPPVPATFVRWQPTVALVFCPNSDLSVADKYSKLQSPGLADGWIFRCATATVLAVGIVFGLFYHSLPTTGQKVATSEDHAAAQVETKAKAKSHRAIHTVAHHSRSSHASARVH